ncbi:hypothetical protein BC828DRAFT_166863 [Blastocladiella britannica]|nr:hypothetical protein BC828DRAFT_166863 [Blastocladiella britannica]
MASSPSGNAIVSQERRGKKAKDRLTIEVLLMRRGLVMFAGFVGTFILLFRSWQRTLANGAFPLFTTLACVFLFASAQSLTRSSFTTWTVTSMRPLSKHCRPN